MMRQAKCHRRNCGVSAVNMRALSQPANLVVGALILWRLGAMAQTSAPDAAPQPARIVTRYVLTSTAQSDAHDPTAWRLLGSNDGGETWATLDSQTNQEFTARSEASAYFTDNRQPYSTYRLKIDAVKSTEVSLDNSVQLAAFGLAGPLVNVPDESKLQVLISSSCADPMRGPAEFAFDDDPTTAWCDYGLGLPGGCWLQIGYAPGSAKPTILVTNLGQATVLTHGPMARARLADGGAGVLSNLTARVVPPRSLGGYALTSATDAAERDPRNWELLGSNDDGKTWAVVENRTNEIFTERLERRVFNLTSAASFRLFRLQIEACAATNQGCQLAGLEPLYADPPADANYSLVVGASSDNPPLESAEMAFDDDFRTKWLSFADASPQNPCWLQWQLTPREDEVPVISQRQLDLLARRLKRNQLLGETNIPKANITGYALTSADDFPGRDPSDWKLLGSNDGGITWDLLDSRQHEEFGSRHQRRVFALAHPVAYRTFRLRIDSVRSPTDAGCVQLAELESLFADPKSASRWTVLASSPGEHPPVETVDRLFDGDVNTKWLDFAASSSNHASWVEWHYAGAGGTARSVVNLNRELATQPLSPKQLELRLAVAVLFADPARGLVGLGDQTDFEWVHLQPWPPGVAPGMQMELKGELRLKGGSLLVSQAGAESLRPLPAASNAAPPPAQPFVLGSIAGRISGIFSGPSDCGATLTLSNGASLQVRLPGQRFPIPPEVACAVRMDGVVQYLMTPGRAWVPGFLWVAKPEQITLAPESEAEWNELPEYSPALPLPSPVRLYGFVEGTNQAGLVTLRVGTNRMAAEFNGRIPAATGTEVEAAGWLATEAGELRLRHACWNTAEAGATSTPLVTRISEVRRLLQRDPKAHARVLT